MKRGLMMTIKAKGSSYCAVKVTVIVFLLVLGLTVVSTAVEDVSRAGTFAKSRSSVRKSSVMA
jgi:hypothetical protein